MSAPLATPILVLGVGLGAPLDLPPSHAAALARADVLAGGRRHLEAFAPAGTRPDLKRIPLTAPLDAALDALAQARAAGARCVVLASGDALHHGVGARLLTRFPCESLQFLPNVTAVQAAMSRLRLPWADAVTVSLHGRDDLAPLLAACQERDLVAVYTDAVHTPATVAQALLERGADWFRLHVLENLGLDGERVRTLALAEAAGGAGADVSPLNLAVLERTGRPPRDLRPGFPDTALHLVDTVYTKFPVRAAAVAWLGTGDGEILWDVGAGHGAVSLEAAAARPRARILALERRADRLEALRRNCQAFGALLVTPRLGEALHLLPELPDPHAVFLGGGLSGERGEILARTCLRRLRPGGRLVAACALLDSLALVRRVLEEAGLAAEVLQLQASAGRPLAGGLHLEAANPVFLVRASKEHP